MNRGITNIIRFVMDECIPPLIRDSKIFMYPFFLFAYRGKKIKDAMNFKANIHKWSKEEYFNFYNTIDTISRNRQTDLNEKSIKLIIKKIDPTTLNLIDVGCGIGYFLNRLDGKNIELHGCDIVDKTKYKNFRFTEANIEKLPFKDKRFDVVVCSHTLEHIININTAVLELKRICKRQLVITVPCQKEFFYTLDEHINFFPFKEKLLSLFNLNKYECYKINGDWVYIGWL